MALTITERIRAGIDAFMMRSPKVPPANPDQSYTGVSGGTTWGVIGARKGALTLRKFSECNVWVRVAINRRKHELARAQWSLIRIDDPKAKPNEKIVQTVKDLFRFVNDTGESFHDLLSKLIEDILVFDAGVCEKELTAGGAIKALWPVSGDEIMPINGWDGSDPKSARYVQIRMGHEVARYRNNELVYMMANPRTCSPIGISPLETLVQTVESDLYGEHLEHVMMKETSPAGILLLGSGIPPEKADEFRMHWEAEIAGTRKVAILSQGGWDPENGPPVEPKWIPFKPTENEGRREYMKWLATKTAAAFEMDLMAFNLSDAVHRSIGENLQAKTDQGLIGLAAVLQAYITREIIWAIDPTFSHGFTFLNLTPENELQKWKVRQIKMQIGCTFPNEIRAQDGDDPVDWGDVPYVTAQSKAADEAKAIEDAESGNTDDADANKDDKDDKADDVDDDQDDDSATSPTK